MASIVRSVGNAVRSVMDINPATLSGAIDIIVVRVPSETGNLDDDEYCSTPFYVKFGKLQLLRPVDRIVSIHINEKEIDLKMKLSRDGFAYFSVDSDCDGSSLFDSEVSDTQSMTNSPRRLSLDNFNIASNASGDVQELNNDVLSLDNVAPLDIASSVVTNGKLNENSKSIKTLNQDKVASGFVSANINNTFEKSDVDTLNTSDIGGTESILSVLKEENNSVNETVKFNEFDKNIRWWTQEEEKTSNYEQRFQNTDNVETSLQLNSQIDRDNLIQHNPSPLTDTNLHANNSKSGQVSSTTASHTNQGLSKFFRMFKRSGTHNVTNTSSLSKNELSVADVKDKPTESSTALSNVDELTSKETINNKHSTEEKIYESSSSSSFRIEITNISDSSQEQTFNALSTNNNKSKVAKKDIKSEFCKSNSAESGIVDSLVVIDKPESVLSELNYKSTVSSDVEQTLSQKENSYIELNDQHENLSDAEIKHISAHNEEKSEKENLNFIDENHLTSNTEHSFSLDTSNTKLQISNEKIESFKQSNLKETDAHKQTKTEFFDFGFNDSYHHTDINIKHTMLLSTCGRKLLYYFEKQPKIYNDETKFTQQSFQIQQIFQQNLLDFHKFSHDPYAYLNENLIVLQQQRLYPFEVILPLLFSMIAFDRMLPHQATQRLSLNEPFNILNRDLLRPDHHLSDPIDTESAITTIDPKLNSKPKTTASHYQSRFQPKMAQQTSQSKPLDICETNQLNPTRSLPRSSSLETLTEKHIFRLDERSSSMSPQPSSHHLSRFSTSKQRTKYKSIRPPGSILKRLNLNQGRNTIKFSVFSSLQGKQSVKAQIYLQDAYNTRIVVSDVDGTITKSDVLGQFLPIFFGSQWSHAGVARLFRLINSNDYSVLYLTSRTIGQADATRNYVFGVVEQHKDEQLPAGPIIMAPDNLFSALKREVFYRRPQDFKIPALREVRNLFPPDLNPFYAGFGNRETDLESYLAVGVPKQRIFLIDSKGNIKSSLNSSLRHSYLTLQDSYDAMFPALNSKEYIDTEYSSMNWQKSVDDEEAQLPVLEDEEEGEREREDKCEKKVSKED